SPLLNQIANNSLLAGNAFLGVQGSTGLADLLGNSLLRRFAQPGAWLTLSALLAISWGFLVGARKRSLAPDQGSSGEMGGDPAQFLSLIFLVGLALVIVPEFFYLRDQFGWRINTIFKFYFQTWILWSVVAAFSVALLWQTLRARQAWVFRVVMVLVILAGLAYPVYAIAGRLNTPLQQLTLDGTGTIARYNPDEMAAITWLRQAPLGVMAEAVGGSYSAYGRFATHSGQPTVLGWPGHESQWRGGALEIGSREGDIERLYRTRNWEEALEILNQYNVTYVVIASLERNRYRADEQLFQQHLREVFRQGEVVIFQYDGSSG
ncbi:MAG: hypothetical protein HPY76_14395, partial [Anaerolineae bacterium]|nr:hypothetical protein [Anaerolineae bacterium]